MTKHWESPHYDGPYGPAIKGILRFSEPDGKLDATGLDEVDWKGLIEAERLGLVKSTGSEIGFVLGSVSLTSIGKHFHAFFNGNPVFDEANRQRRRDLVPYADVLREFGPEVARREARVPAEVIQREITEIFAERGYVAEEVRS